MLLFRLFLCTRGTLSQISVSSEPLKDKTSLQEQSIANSWDCTGLICESNHSGVCWARDCGAPGARFGCCFGPIVECRTQILLLLEQFINVPCALISALAPLLATVFKPEKKTGMRGFCLLWPPSPVPHARNRL